MRREFVTEHPYSQWPVPAWPWIYSLAILEIGLPRPFLDDAIRHHSISGTIMIRHCKWPLKELRTNVWRAKKRSEKARKAVVCNQPGTNPTMFYYTERCILKEDAHTYKRINRRAATFQKRADKEHQSIKSIVQPWSSTVRDELFIDGCSYN
jgi:hypothetical protein